MRRKILLPVAAALCLAPPLSQAVSPIPAARLRADCAVYLIAPRSPDGLRCPTYIQGFLDGAIVTDARVARDISAEFEKSETISQRAARTRLRQRQSRIPTFYAGFCVGDPVPIANVVTRVIAHIEANPPAELATAASAVYAALRASYPCRSVE